MVRVYIRQAYFCMVCHGQDIVMARLNAGLYSTIYHIGICAGDSRLRRIQTYFPDTPLTRRIRGIYACVSHFPPCNEYKLVIIHIMNRM